MAKKEEQLDSTDAPEGFRLVQVFLHVNGDIPEIHEVSIHDGAGLLHCTCKVKSCVHMNSVVSAMRGGSYPVRKHKGAPLPEDREYTIAEQREYILKWHKILVTSSEG